MKTTKQFRKQLVLAGAVLICGVALIGMIYIYLNKPEVYITPGIVVSNPSPVAVPIMPKQSNPLLTARPIPTHVSYPPKSSRQTASSVPSSLMHGLWTTSSARVHVVGGGQNQPIATVSGGSSSSRGIIQTSTAVMPMTNFLALASSTPMASPEAQEAPAMAKIASSPNKAPGPPTTGDDPLPGEHQLVPIGAPWVLLLFALLYAIIRRKTKKNGICLHMSFFFCTFAPDFV